MHEFNVSDLGLPLSRLRDSMSGEKKFVPGELSLDIFKDCLSGVKGNDGKH